MEGMEARRRGSFQLLGPGARRLPAKRLLVHVAGFNLGLVMRSLFGIGKPRRLQGLAASLFRLFSATEASLAAVWAYLLAPLWIWLLDLQQRSSSAATGKRLANPAAA